MHIGTAVNFSVIHAIAVHTGADIALRIDDMDGARRRPEYVADVFEMLNWLKLPWSYGPRDQVEATGWSQAHRLPEYRRALQRLHRSGATYACSCRRSAWTGYQGDECPHGCRTAETPFVPGETSWRFHLDKLPDPVVWRVDDVPAYHLTSIVDDNLWKVDLVIRGEDLTEATYVQREISLRLPGSTFHQAKVLHHGLIRDAEGNKLSKSAGSGSRPLSRDSVTRSTILSHAARILEQLLPVLA